MFYDAFWHFSAQSQSWPKDKEEKVSWIFDTPVQRYNDGVPSGVNRTTLVGFKSETRTTDKTSYSCFVQCH
jgi:hypothetical protein